MTSPISAIVFDFDGVLADSEPIHLRVYQELLEPVGVTLTKEQYCARYLGFDDEGAFRQMGSDFGLLMGDVAVGKVQLPDFQREWKWEDPRIASLLATVSC